jgi:hypothetical protein
MKGRPRTKLESGARYGRLVNQYDAGMSRRDAEVQAFEDVKGMKWR